MDARDLFPAAPAQWERTTLGAVCRRAGGNIQTGPFGSQLHASDYVPVGVPSIMPINIGDNRLNPSGIARVRESDAIRLSKHRVQPGDIIYSRRGDVERRALVRESEAGWLCGTGCLKVRFGDGVIDPLFASFYLGHPGIRSWIVRHAVGATMPNLNTAIMEAIPFLLPPIDIQRRIADILGTLDDKIELNRRMNETLEAMARRLFRSWFVDFDPVHAKAALRRQHPKLSNADLSRRALPNMEPEIAELFPDGFEESALGSIPKGWKLSRIDQLVAINEWTLGKADELDTIDYVEISQVMNGDVGEVVRYPRGEEPSRARRRLRHGDTVLSTVRPDRRAYFIAVDPPTTLIASTGFAVCTADAVPWSWSACALTAPEVFEFLGHHADGGAYPAVNPAIIGGIEYAVPTSEALLQKFHMMAADWYQLADANRRQSRRFAITRDKLLPRLLSGNLQLND